MILTYKYRIKDRRAKKWLAEYAFATNQAWNYCVAFQRDIEARYRAGAPKRKWPTHFDLTYLTSGSAADLGVHSGTVNAVCRQFVQARNAKKRAPRFRASGGPRRALGWVPFRRDDRRIDGNTIVYLGRRYRIFGSKRRPIPETAGGGAFVEDALGRWWLCLQAEVANAPTGGAGAVGVDLGLKALATLSDGQAVPALQHYRQYEQRLATAQRAGNRRRVKAIHAKIANARRDQHHKATTNIVRLNQFIAVGDVSPSRLAKTKMAKSILDAGWAGFKNMLRYKASRHGAAFIVVNEAWTSQVCSSCGSNPSSSPKGIGALGIRVWECSDCGASHDRDVNAARNILRLGRSAVAHADGSRRAA